MKSKLFENELKTFKNDDIRLFVIRMLNDAPEYFYDVAASSTGKYHPRYALNTGGLMRHTKAVVRFYNHIMTLEQYTSQFTPRQIDLGRVACIAHDIQKSGTEEYYKEQSAEGKKVFTVYDHPLLSAKYIMNYKDENLLPEEDLTYIALACGTHMGQWNTDKSGKEILPKPTSAMQQIVHLSDYLASRKDLDVSFEGDEYAYQKQDISEMICPFKKYKGMKFIDVAATDPDYLAWLWNNTTLTEPIKSCIEKLLNK